MQAQVLGRQLPKSVFRFKAAKFDNSCFSEVTPFPAWGDHGNDPVAVRSAATGIVANAPIAFVLQR
jgi:hypothetical protein